MKVIALPYKPRPLQRVFHQERTRFCVMLCHRRFGKTVAAINDLIREAVRTGKPDWRAAYAAPYAGQAKAIAWDYLRYFASGIPDTHFHETELRCDFATGARIRLYGVDNAHALRGLYLDDLVLDEPADMPREVWTQILRPALADRQGRALFIGTPNGTENLLHDVWEMAGKNTESAWSRFCFRASETGYVAQSELDAARAAMAPEEYAQEFECSFAAAVRGAYYASLLERAEQEQRIAAVPHNPALPVHSAWDLGMDDATSIWFFQVQPSGAWAFIDFYSCSGEGLAHYAGILQEKAQRYHYVYGKHIAPHDIQVRELGTGISRFACAAQLGIRFELAPRLPLHDGIDAVRRALPRCWFDAQRCAAGLRALHNYRRVWQAREQVFTARPQHDWTSHAADALRYALTGFRPSTQEQGIRQARTQYNIFGSL
jgi:phage terminase large subunit